MKRTVVRLAIAAGLVGAVLACPGQAQDAQPRWRGVRMLAEIRSLPADATAVIGSDWTDDHLEALAAKSQTVWLKLDRAGALTPTGLRRLAVLPRLRHLVLEDDSATDAWMGAIATWPALEELQAYRSTRVSATGLSALAGATHLARLVIDGPRGDADCTALGRMNALEELFLHDTRRVTDAGLHALARCQRLARLTFWGSPAITDAGVATLAALPHLELLTIRECPALTDAACEHLSRCHTLARLELMGAVGVTTKGVERLMSLPALVGVGFWTRPLTDEDASVIAMNPRIRSLTCTGAATLTDRGLAALATLPSLQTLYLRGGGDWAKDSMRITRTGLDALSKCRHLTWVLLGRADLLTPADVRSLAAALPKCRIDIEPGVRDPDPAAQEEPAADPAPAVDADATPYAEVRDRLLEAIAPAKIPSPVGKPFIAIRSYAAGSESPPPRPGHRDPSMAAWLLAETDAELEILDLDLEVRRLPKDPRRKGIARGRPEGLSAPDKEIRGRQYPWYEATEFPKVLEEILSGGAEGFRQQPWRALNLTWLCEQFGLSKEAERAYRIGAEAFALGAPVHMMGERASASESIFERWREAFGVRLRAEAITGLRDGKARREMAAVLTRAAMLYPAAAPERAESDAVAAMLLAQAVEDEARAIAPRPALASLAGDARVDELLYRLRDLHAQQQGFPGRCYVLDGGWGKEDTPPDPADPHPAEALRAIGKPAIPALIARLEDLRPTRCFAAHRWFALSSYHVLRYCDVAEQILCAITGRDQGAHYRTTYAYLSLGGDPEAARKDWERWWEGVKGQSLTDLAKADLASEDTRVRLQALHRLLDDPSFSDEALLEGEIRKVTASDDLARLAWSMDARSREFRQRIWEWMRGHDSLAVILAVTRAARKAGEAAALGDVVPLLTERVQRSPTEWDLGHFGVGELVDLCVEIGSPEAYGVVELLLVRGGLDEQMRVLWHLKGVKSPAVERAALGLLRDLHTRSGMSHSWRDIQYSSPRLCDVAAMAFADRLELGNAFNPAASEAMRDLQIRRIEAAVRQRLGMAALPAFSGDSPLPQVEVAGPLAAAVSDSDAERATAITSLRALGPRAGLNVVAGMAGATDGAPRARLREVLEDLVTTLRGVTITSERGTPPPDARAWLPAAGERLAPGALHAFVAALVKDGNWTGVWIRMDREPGLDSVLAVEIEPGRVGGFGGSGGCNWTDPLGGGSGTVQEFLEQLKEVGADIARATAADPGASKSWMVHARWW